MGAERNIHNKVDTIVKNTNEPNIECADTDSYTPEEFREKISKAVDRIKNGNAKNIEKLDGESITELDNEGIKNLATLADTSHSHIIRILEEEEIDYAWQGSTPPLYFEDLKETHKEIIRKWEKRIDPTYTDISNQFDMGYKAVRRVIRNYSWMIEYHDIESNDFNGTEDIVGTPTEALENLKNGDSESIEIKKSNLSNILGALYRDNQDSLAGELLSKV